MLRLARFFAVFTLVVMLLAPGLADARAGSSAGSAYSSMGSRGSRTYNALPGAQPLQRSLTPQAPVIAPTAPGYAAPIGGYGLYPRHSFLSGLGAGLFGAWIGSMLFGGPAYASSGFAGHSGGFLGTLVTLALLFWVGRMIWRSVGAGLMDGSALRGARPAYAGPAAGAYRPTPMSSQPVLALQQRDFDAFTHVLTGVQQAWSKGDLPALSRLVTPEMLAYFSEQLANNASHGQVNRVQNVTLLHGEPCEAWSEGFVDYATARLRWSAIDYTERLDRPGALVAGDYQQPVVAEEFWTFRRTAGGSWMLSAIQQTV